MRYPADPPTVEEIVAVMRHGADDRHGWRVRAMIVVLWRAGLRIQEALALAEHDIDPRRGSLLVRNGKGGRRREVGSTSGAGSSCTPGWPRAPSCPSGRCSASSTDRPADGHGPARRSAASSAGSPQRPGSGEGSRRTSSDTRTRSSSPARASRSTSSIVSSGMRTSARRRSTFKGSTPRRSSRPCARAARR
jgi:integrase-like protein